jgi:putative transposase
VYTLSARKYRPPDHPEYAFHDWTIPVTQCDRICIGRRKINFTRALAEQYIGGTEVADDTWLVSFMDFDLRFFDRERGEASRACGRKPICSKSLPMCPEWTLEG